MIYIKNVSLEIPIINYEQRSFKRQLFSTKQKIIKNQILKNVNLQFSDTDSVGLIGQNGSGKSTLLKLLGGVYKPTSGDINIEDKTCLISDLSAGTLENLSGYQNIIIKSIFLDLKKDSKNNKIINNIIEFSDLKDQIYKMYKTYSDGMKIRLLISIILFLMEGVLLIDEIIGAGDIEFSKKTINFIKTNREKFKSIIIASHDINILNIFCNKGVFLKDGEVIYEGTIGNAYKEYLKSLPRT